MNKATKNLVQKTKMEKYLNATGKYFAKFYIGLTAAMYFRMLGEQVP